MTGGLGERAPLHARAMSTAPATPRVPRPLHLSELRVPGAAMLATAALMNAAGAHIGLACPLRSATGIPCPLCGMTTSVRATVGGDLADAFVATPAGIVAVAVTLFALVARGRDVVVPKIALGAGLAAMWTWQLFRFELL